MKSIFFLNVENTSLVLSVWRPPVALCHFIWFHFLGAVSSLHLVCTFLTERKKSNRSAQYSSIYLKLIYKLPQHGSSKKLGSNKRYFVRVRKAHKSFLYKVEQRKWDLFSLHHVRIYLFFILKKLSYPKTLVKILDLSQTMHHDLVLSSSLSLVLHLDRFSEEREASHFLCAFLLNFYGFLAPP